jgi:hypothetical protein
MPAGSSAFILSLFVERLRYKKLTRARFEAFPTTLMITLLHCRPPDPVDAVKSTMSGDSALMAAGAFTCTLGVTVIWDDNVMFTAATKDEAESRAAIRSPMRYR